MEILKQSWRKTPKLVREISVAIVGTLVVCAGIIMLVIPGPGWVVIFLGLAILSTEFTWANNLRVWLTRKFKSAFEALKQKNNQRKK